MSNDRTTDEWTADRSHPAGPGPHPGADLEVTTSAPYLLYNAAAPLTEWIEADDVVELEAWL